MLPLLLVLQLGCGSEPAPPPPTSPPPQPEFYRWRLASAESETPGVSSGFPPSGGSHLPQDCRGTCIAEHWQPLDVGDPGQHLGPAVFVREGRSHIIHLGSERLEAVVRWPLMGGVLGPCVGDPLSLPPADDPQGNRMLELQGSDLRWVLLFSGANACHLAGELRLPIQGGRVDAILLEVDGQPWSEGGAKRAAELRRAWLRLLVRESWPELTAEDQILALKGLSEDPSPEAASLLQVIIDRDPSAADDAERALQHRLAAGLQDQP